MEIITDENKIDEILERGILSDFYPTKEDFKKKLQSGERLKFYMGFDPTAKSLHLGHSQGLLILEDFRKLGHEVIFLIGDFTGMIGDPTDKSSARVKQTKEEVKENFEGWVEQVKNIISFDDKENPAQVKYNSEWLGKLSFADVLELASNFTVQQMLKRDMFEKRFKGEIECLQCGKVYSADDFIAYNKINIDFDINKEDNNLQVVQKIKEEPRKCFDPIYKNNIGLFCKNNVHNDFLYYPKKPIYLHEFMYPLMQGYDSVAMEVDVELCGTDQIFNALAGRTLLKKLKNKEKFVVSTILIQDEKTGQLMSKSNNTGVFLDLPSNELYGAIMAQTDGMIRPLFVGCTRLSLDEIEENMKLENPRDAKMKLAFEIVKSYRSEDEAKKAEEAFTTQFQKGDVPEDLEEVEVEAGGVLNIIVSAGLASSNSEARRKVEEGAVKIDDEKIEDPKMEITAGEKIMKVGRRIVKIIVK